MLLAADVGNALITLGVHDGAAWRARWQLRSDPERTGEEYGLLLEGLLRRAGLDGRITRLALASAVPALGEVFRDLAVGWFGCPFLAVGPGVKTGLALRVDHPSEVGPDLVANAVAAYARFGAACVAVDFGT
ncbi:MAG: type III pantothenate kinase, partial [Candidatus Bipolaricaulota bacterium]|nr:type III pantothenate kinase [Candidatus Bipolaricaulota bacterium]